MMKGLQSSYENDMLGHKNKEKFIVFFLFLFFRNKMN